MKFLLVFINVWDLRSNFATLAFVINLHLNSMHVCEAHADLYEMENQAQTIRMKGLTNALSILHKL